MSAPDDMVRHIRENLPHIEWEQPLAAERERLAADEIERLRAEVERLTQQCDDYSDKIGNCPSCRGGHAFDPPQRENRWINTPHRLPRRRTGWGFTTVADPTSQGDQ